MHFPSSRAPRGGKISTLVLVACVIFLVLLPESSNSALPSLRRITLSATTNLGECSATSAPSFLDLCERFGTDKCTGAHAYHHAYENVLTPYRCRAGGGRFLEIGLGCGHYAASEIHEGRSFALWLEYFSKDGRVATLEFDAACVESFIKPEPAQPDRRYLGTRNACVRLADGTR